VSFKKPLNIIHKDIGGIKRLYSLAVPIAAAICFPFAMFSYFTVSDSLFFPFTSSFCMKKTSSTGSLFSWDVFSAVVGVSIIGNVGDFYVESMLSNQVCLKLEG
jgi:hypothetical protein